LPNDTHMALIIAAEWGGGKLERRGCGGAGVGGRGPGAGGLGPGDGGRGSFGVQLYVYIFMYLVTVFVI